MTTYRTIASTETDPYAPIVAQLMKALALNPVAITEGAAGAPKIQFAAMDAWYSTAGAVGSYAFARRASGTADIGFGGLIAGSELEPVGAFSGITTGGFSNHDLTAGSPLSGTWQAMGHFDAFVAVASYGTASGATLWQRVS